MSDKKQKSGKKGTPSKRPGQGNIKSKRSTAKKPTTKKA
jgi:hypothetical protein